METNSVYLLPKRFIQKIRFTETCWLWTAYIDKDGYGRYSVGSRRDKSKTQVGAHRFCWELVNGKIPNGLQALHKCDNPTCVNPDHLFLGTAQDNVSDRVTKGRSAFGIRNGTRTHPEKRRRGEEQWMSKLTQSQVDEMRLLYRRGVPGEFSLRGLAKRYGINYTHVSRIVNDKNWRLAI